MNIEDIISELKSLERVGVYFDRDWGQTRETYRGELDYVKVSDIIELISRIKISNSEPK